MGDDTGDLDKLVRQALMIEEEEAREAGAVRFMARAMTQATMPHKATPGNEFKRRNGSFILSMLAPSDIGLPYGSIPRLLVSWIRGTTTIPSFLGHKDVIRWSDCPTCPTTGVTNSFPGRPANSCPLR